MKFFPLIIIRKKHVEEIQMNFEVVQKQLAKAQRAQLLIGVCTFILVCGVIYYLITKD